MASVFEFLGIKTQSVSTSVPLLGINTDPYKLQREAENYFVIPKSAQAANGNALAVNIKEGQNFLSTNSTHIEFLKKCIALFKDKSTQLHSVDQKILGSIAFGVVATALSFLPVVGFLGWIGWGAAVYYINQRATAYAEYHESLTLLVGACNWSLGEGPGKRKDRSIEQLTKNETVRHMMATLYPVLTEVQVGHLIADDIEDIFAQELKEYDTKFQLGFNPHQFFSKKDDIIALSKKGAEFNRCIYGFNKGGFTDFFDAIVSILPDLYKATLHGFQQLKYWWQGRTHSAENTEELRTSEVGLTH
ncbi:hypothetical protein [Legionella cincinnatiensis]|uniref:Uncharacterized protein n=1 Tax=Legionella cincinnatiensis TaxID=28085 RepID=A0A378IGJ6_9GAMM|nr:hypothetical protein [Legionella cincinnatiensis]KTC86251.1 hypothetical protein Lcin_1711 [Legionella cincinnatiensis]STX33862.1 Uncharacterised protein [Legionella cincinnatiensis]